MDVFAEFEEKINAEELIQTYAVEDNDKLNLYLKDLYDVI
jgi:hypothetical protein